MISGQSPESRNERRQRRRDEEIEEQLAQAALREIVTSFGENSLQTTDTIEPSEDDM